MILPLLGWGWVQPTFQHYLKLYYDSEVVIPESYNLTKAWLSLLSDFAQDYTLDAGELSAGRLTVP